MTRIPLDDLTSDQYDALYADRERLAATLREVLDAFEAYWARASYCGSGGSAVQPEHLQAWRATLTQPAAATEATEPHTGLVVQPYRNDAGQPVWVFRCWGTDTCDGYLSLDHTSRQWAERARDRHAAEDHPPTPVPCPACARAGQAGLAPTELHAECRGQEQP
jgi:hypothetical protein